MTSSPITKRISQKQGEKDCVSSVHCHVGWIIRTNTRDGPTLLLDWSGERVCAAKDGLHDKDEVCLSVRSPRDSVVCAIARTMNTPKRLTGSSHFFSLFLVSSPCEMSSSSASSALASAAKRVVGKLKPETTAMLLCDIQDRFRPLIYRGETVVRTAQYMTGVAKALDIPVVATQQYTKVFGQTVQECFANPDDLEKTPIFEKKLFSMVTDECKAHLDRLNRSSYILFGIEAHVCVQQTALDLLEVRVWDDQCLAWASPFLFSRQDGHDVHIIVDGVSSQQPYDREIALQRLSQAGAYLTTAQSAAFMLMQSKYLSSCRLWCVCFSTLV